MPLTCDRLYYTLQIPTDLDQDVPALDIRRFQEGFEPPSPSVVGNVQAIAYTPAQFPLMSGALSDRFEWAIACLLSEDESLQLAALYAWQQRRLKKDLDPRLQWTDRMETTDPEPADELSRDITDAKTTTYGLVYGFPVVKCLISKPSRQLVGNRNGVPTRLCTFVVGEYR